MKHMRSRRWRGQSFVAGVLIGLSIATPVFAAASSPPAHWHTFFMLGALVLLIVGVMLEAVLHMELPRNSETEGRRESITPHANGEDRRSGAASNDRRRPAGRKPRLNPFMARSRFGRDDGHVIGGEIVDTDARS